MAARAHRPEVDEGDPPGPWATLREMLAPAPGRLHNTLLLVGQVLVVVTIWEVFRIPEAALAAYVVLFASRDDAASTLLSAAVIGIAASMAALGCIAVFAVSLSQPALRLPLMALFTFFAMLLSRASPLGPAAFGFGFILVYGLTVADEIQGVALQSGEVTNTSGVGLPQLAFMPPEEALVHMLLWITMVASVPAVLLVITNRLAGRDPASMLRATLADRLSAAAAFCRGQHGAADRLEALAREGSSGPLKWLGLAEKKHGTGYRHEANLALVRSLNRLVLLLCAWSSVERATSAGRTDAADEWLHPVGKACDAIAADLRGGRPHLTPPRPSLPTEFPADAPAAQLALSIELRRTMAATWDAEQARAEARPKPDAAAVASRKPLLLPNSLNAANIQFALKVTLSVMTAYIIENTLGWLAIDTCVVTCFFVSLGSIGESAHKMTLRMTGCLIGGALGIGSILLLMPVMTELGELLVLVAVVTFIAGWIACGSQRISYAGWQLALAFYLTTLQGFGPTLDMQTARDRLLGILLGNVIVFLVFSYVWPVRVADVVRPGICRALETLGEMMTLGGRQAGASRDISLAEAEAGLRERFGAAIATAGSVLINDRYEAGEAGRGRITRGLIGRIQALVVPVSVIVTDVAASEPLDLVPSPLRQSVREHHDAMADWFRRAASWVRSGEGGDGLRAALPGPPDLNVGGAGLPADIARRLEGRAVLYRLLDRNIHAVLDDVVPQATPGTARLPAGKDLAIAGG